MLCLFNDWCKQSFSNIFFRSYWCFWCVCPFIYFNNFELNYLFFQILVNRATVDFYCIVIFETFSPLVLFCAANIAFICQISFELTCS